MDSRLFKEIKSKVNIIHIINYYGLKITNNFIQCPFHSDSKPSMYVYPNGCKCFACGQYADIFTFVEQMEHTDLKGAVRFINNKFNLGLLRPLSDKEKADIAKHEQERQAEIKRKQQAEFERRNALNKICKVLKQTEKFIFDFNKRFDESDLLKWWENFCTNRKYEYFYSVIAGLDIDKDCEYYLKYGIDKDLILKEVTK